VWLGVGWACEGLRGLLCAARGAGGLNGDFLRALRIIVRALFCQRLVCANRRNEYLKLSCHLVEGDVELRLPRGHIHVFGGYIRYDDNDPIANNNRDLYFYSVEGVHEITRKLYAGIRFSQIFAPNGYALVANGDNGQYLHGPLTSDLWRFDSGPWIPWSPNLVTKAEYTFERGKEVSGKCQRP